MAMNSPTVTCNTEARTLAREPLYTPLNTPGYNLQSPGRRTVLRNALSLWLGAAGAFTAPLSIPVSAGVAHAGNATTPNTTAPPATVPNAGRLALLIGNGDYPVPHDLPPIAKNVMDLGEALAFRGFDVTQAMNLDESSLQATVTEFVKRVAAAPGDTVTLFYYAGHGLQVDSNNLLLGSGSNPTAPRKDLIARSLVLQQKLLTLRWLGVLQRIGLVYFITLLIVLYCASRGRILWLLGLCAVYLLAMLFVPYQDAQGNQFRGLLLFGNSFAAWLDHTLLGAGHVYYPSATPFAFDPEGLWSTLPAVASCLSGVLIAQWLQSGRNLVQQIRGLLLFGVVAVWLAELWHFSLPINKSLWTPSFVLLSSGYCAIALAACIWLCDVKGWRRWSAPFVVFGANAILFFMLAGITGRLLGMLSVGQSSLHSWLFVRVYQPLFGNYNGSLAFAVSFLLLSYLLMHWCYKRGYLLKV